MKRHGHLFEQVVDWRMYRQASRARWRGLILPAAVSSMGGSFRGVQQLADLAGRLGAGAVRARVFARPCQRNVASAWLSRRTSHCQRQHS